MPSAPRGRHAFPPAVLLLVLAACAGQGGDTTEEDVSAAGAVRAFANICGRPELDEVTRRAGVLGFMAIDPTRLPPQSRPADPAQRVMVRPGFTPGALSAVLAFNPRGPTCQLELLGVPGPALEREFDRMVGVIARQPNLRTQPLQMSLAGGSDPNPLPVRRAVLVTGQPGAGGAPQLIVLRATSAEQDAPQARAALSLHVAQPRDGGGAIPPPSAPVPPRG
ncbi:MAG: hypothetical protein K2X74_06600 [Acetobacteraceae bacterium]|nr:hypothetical protein [Acetobacteraceae bacterium]